MHKRIFSFIAAGVLIAGAGMAIACGDDDDDDNSMPNEVVTSAAGGTSVTGAATVVTGAVGTSAAGATGGKLTDARSPRKITLTISRTASMAD